jgi:hypothetical protein
VLLERQTQTLGIGTTGPSTNLHVKDAASSGAFSSLSKQIIEGGDNTYLEISTPADHYGGVLFSDGTSGQGAILYDHTNDILHLKTNATNRLNISSAGNVGIGTGTPAQKLDVVGATQTGDLIVTGSTLAVQKTIKNDITADATLSDSFSHYMATCDNQGGATTTLTCPPNPSVGDEYWIVAKCSYASAAPSNALVRITPNTNQTINQAVAAGSHITLNLLSSGTAPAGMPTLDTYKTAHLICIDADQWVLTISDVGPTS